MGGSTRPAIPRSAVRLAPGTDPPGADEVVVDPTISTEALRPCRCLYAAIVERIPFGDFQTLDATCQARSQTTPQVAA